MRYPGIKESMIMSKPRKLRGKILNYFTVPVTNCSANNNIKSMKMKENIGTKFKNNFIKK